LPRLPRGGGVADDGRQTPDEGRVLEAVWRSVGRLSSIVHRPSAAMTTHVFGIRHHGPGSARSLREALEGLAPDAILVEGPPDAAEVLPLLAHPEMRPPVALLVYRPDAPARAVHFPLTVFSPEWQAIYFGLTRAIPVRFMDLP